MRSDFKAGDVLKVRHPLWQADLIVGPEARRLRHSVHHSTASYDAAGDVLWVNWDDYDAEVFVRRGEEYLTTDLARGGAEAATGQGSLDLGRRPFAMLGGSVVPVEAVSLRLPGGVGRLLVRPGTSDIPVLEAIFVAGEYDVPVLTRECDIIVDLGANTGLSSAYFAHRCPDAKVIAVEPARSNFSVLVANAQHRPTILPVEAAVWPEDGVIALQDAGAAGEEMQPWAFRTVERGSGLGSYAVEAISIPTLMRRYGLGFIDVLKIDIEGAEHPLFLRGTEAWLPKVRAIVIETHERFCPGVDDLVTRTLAADFSELAPSGENRIFVRRA